MDNKPQKEYERLKVNVYWAYSCIYIYMYIVFIYIYIEFIYSIYIYLYGSVCVYIFLVHLIYSNAQFTISVVAPLGALKSIPAGLQS